MELLIIEQAQDIVKTNRAKYFIQLYWGSFIDTIKYNTHGFSVEGRNIYLLDEELLDFIEEIRPAFESIGFQCSLSHHTQRKILLFKCA